MPVVVFKPVGGAQVYELAPVAVRLVLLNPEQIVGDEIAIAGLGNGATLTNTVLLAVIQPLMGSLAKIV